MQVSLHEFPLRSAIIEGPFNVVLCLIDDSAVLDVFAFLILEDFIWNDKKCTVWTRDRTHCIQPNAKCEIIFALTQDANDLQALTRITKRTSIIPIADQYMLLDILSSPPSISHQPVKDHQSYTIEMIQWMTWGREPIPYDLACHVYYECASGDRDVLHDRASDPNAPIVYQTIHEFLKHDHYIAD